MVSRGSGMLLGLAAALSVAASPATAAAGSGPRLPPLDRGAPVRSHSCAHATMWMVHLTVCPARADPNRCERAYTGNTIGQVLFLMHAHG